ncbi:MAG TPA: histidine kinase [Acidimicrobiales bacterium]|nr:histidine kinase [Acidimicrobiales bacterium]
MTATEITRIVVIALWAITTGVLLRLRAPKLAIITGVGTVAAGVSTLAAALVAHRDLSASSADRLHLSSGIALGVVGAAGVHLLLAMPNGEVPQRARRMFVAFAYVAGVACGAAAFVDRPDIRWWLLALAGIVGGALGVVLSNQRYRRASPLEQRSLQWFGLSIAVAAEVCIVVLALHVIADWPSSISATNISTTAIIALGTGASASRRLSARVDRALTYAVSFTGLTSMVLVIYVIVVLSFGRSLSDGERSLLVASMGAAGLAALAYPVARARLEVAANRLVYGERVAPDDAVRKFGTRLTRAVPMDELLLQLCESLRKTMRLHSAEVWTGSDGVYEVAASAPHRNRAPLHVSAKAVPVTARAGVSGGTWIEIWLPELAEGRVAANLRVAPLAHGGGLLGLVVCERSPDGDPFTRDADTTLTELARQVALALHNVNLDSALQASLDELRHKNIELHESRARIVAAGDAERRRLERNLHDGAQQHLVALAVKVRLARDAVEDDPADAMSLLDELRTDLQDAIAELRALAHGIFPPLLVSGGLVHALPAAASRATLPATVECIDIERYEPELEAAVYFCCVEAMQNASKHAGEGAKISLRVWRDNDELCFTVSDDGAGFDPAGSAGKGHGFVNMADRLGAMQGSLDVWSVRGEGTRISGRVPVTRVSATADGHA